MAAVALICSVDAARSAGGPAGGGGAAGTGSAGGGTAAGSTGTGSGVSIMPNSPQQPNTGNLQGGPIQPPRFAPAGVNQAGPVPMNPAGNAPMNPAGNTPQNPAGTTPANPGGNLGPSNPGGNLGPGAPFSPNLPNNATAAPTQNQALTTGDRVILGRIGNSLQGVTPVNGMQVNFLVQNGFVTLVGTAPTQAAAQQLESVVARVPGVMGVNDQLQINSAGTAGFFNNNSPGFLPTQTPQPLSPPPQ